MYPAGAYEKYPNMVDTRNMILTNTAHDYMECSNKGLCDRTAGTCTCFEGYDGSACQRSSCPSSSAGSCSGHGMCATIKEIAKYDYKNSYNLWDEHSTMGCVCDAGFEGPDCSKIQCKVGADPLYYDDEVNVRYSNFTFALWNIDYRDAVLDLPGSGTTPRIQEWVGNYSLVFYDAHGEDWHTAAIDIAADCDDIRKALEAIPNSVIPLNSVRCSMDFASVGTYVADTYALAASLANVKPIVGIPDGFPAALPPPYLVADKDFGPFVGTKFTLAFPANPGKLRQPEINIDLDGSRRTVNALTSRAGLKLEGTTAVLDAVRDMVTEVRTWVFPNGFAGEDVDFAPDLCVNVRVTLKQKSAPAAATWGQFDSISAAEAVLLKRCLGDADGDRTNNNRNKASDTQDALYNWDYGIEPTSFTNKASFTYDMDRLLNPHLIKLVDTSTSSATRLCDNDLHQFSGASDIKEVGYCNNPDPPGFYAVLYFDPKLNTFSFLSRAWQDYETATEFHVFTTTGYLQLTSKDVEVFSSYLPVELVAAEASFTTADVPAIKKISADLNRLYSNVVYTTSSASNGAIKNIDCETAADDVLQCIEKGDYVMIFDTAAETLIGKSQNPKYMNIYQVMKISRESIETTSEVLSDTDPTMFRYQIVLDMGLNARYLRTKKTGGGDELVPSNARVYKFTPPADPVKYVGPCSLRGICDSTNGLCTCFPGYTSDDCSAMNALAL